MATEMGLALGLGLSKLHMSWTVTVIVALVVVGLFVLKRLSFISADKARGFLRQGALVVDVRTPAEFTSGHLPGAVNLPLDNLISEVPRRIPDKNRSCCCTA